MHDVSNLRTTIVPKSDQLNAEQLLGGEMTLNITGVSLGNEDQPVVIHYEGDNGRPFKPCKTMRKLLIYAWGENGNEWAGRAMTVYNDPNVKFGGSNVGGIRISAMSHIDSAINISLTATKGKKATHTVQVLRFAALADVLAAIEAATGRDSLAHAKKLAEQLSPADVPAAVAAYKAKVSALKEAKQ